MQDWSGEGFFWNLNEIQTVWIVFCNIYTYLSLDQDSRLSVLINVGVNKCS